MGLLNSTPEQARHVATQICERLGATLDRYLGAGAYKLAFLASLNGQPIALKLAEINTSVSGRFEREIAALRSCSHSAIARLEFISTERLDDTDYFVIGEEFLAGGTLLERLRAAPLPLPEIHQLGIDLAGAIAHLQERNLVHRDIKPANVLFRTADAPVLTDFGIVRILGEPSLTHDFIPQGPGTPLYASPEQLNNDKALIDWRADQFGLSLVLAECVLGRPAFTLPGQSALDAVMAVASRSSLPDQSRQELEAAGFGPLTRALAPWPVQRFRRPADFLDALTRN
jgi:serine/threonine protein kinase